MIDLLYPKLGVMICWVTWQSMVECQILFLFSFLLIKKLNWKHLLLQVSEIDITQYDIKLLCWSVVDTENQRWQICGRVWKIHMLFRSCANNRSHCSVIQLFFPDWDYPQNAFSFFFISKGFQFKYQIALFLSSLFENRILKSKYSAIFFVKRFYPKSVVVTLVVHALRS